MAKKLGRDYHLWIESATPGTYNVILGQVDLTVNRNQAFIDSSSKDDGTYGTQAPGQRSLTIDFSVIPNLPDANGYTRLETNALADPQEPTMFQIRKGGTAGADPGDVVFEASMYVGDFTTAMGKDDPVRATGNLSLAAAPVTDALL